MAKISQPRGVDRVSMVPEIASSTLQREWYSCHPTRLAGTRAPTSFQRILMGDQSPRNWTVRLTCLVTRNPKFLSPVRGEPVRGLKNLSAAEWPNIRMRDIDVLTSARNYARAH
jgi:hypothetical protein